MNRLKGFRDNAFKTLNRHAGIGETQNRIARPTERLPREFSLLDIDFERCRGFDDEGTPLAARQESRESPKSAIVPSAS